MSNREVDFRRIEKSVWDAPYVVLAECDYDASNTTLISAKNLYDAVATAQRWEYGNTKILKNVEYEIKEVADINSTKEGG